MQHVSAACGMGRWLLITGAAGSVMTHIVLKIAMLANPVHSGATVRRATRRGRLEHGLLPPSTSTRLSQHAGARAAAGHPGVTGRGAGGGGGARVHAWWSSPPAAPRARSRARPARER